MGSAARILLGLAVAAVAQFIAIALAGAGHGWTTPFRASFALWFALPLVYALAAPKTGYVSQRKWVLVTLLGFALLSDLYLVGATNAEGWSYFDKSFYLAPLFTTGWLAIWLSWQVAIGMTLARGEREPVIA